MGLGGNPNYYVLSNIPQVGNIADNTIDSTDNHPPGSHDGGAGAPTNTNDPALPAELVYQLELNEQGNVDALVDPNDATTETGRYSWLYLLRPANPLDPASEKVIVDSMRFVYVAGGGGITYDPMSDTHTVTDNDDLRIYSTARRQPLRGNQSVPGEEAALPSNQQRTPKFAYGYSDGTAYSEDDSPGGPAVTIHGRFTGRQNGAQQLFEMTDPWHQSLGAENEPDDDWNLFPFFDRDFSSPAELLLVPGVSPGLFTKQFVDQERIFLDDDPDPGYVTGSGNTPLATPVLDDDPDDIEPQGDGIGAAPVFPYLPENFYYTPSNDPADNDPTPTVAPNENAVIGGPTSMGWHKLLEWFEVPSSTLGAIGTMADGQNLDWLRRDVRPGQINLNLVIDEEVFFGIIDDARLNRGAIVNPGVPPSVVTLTQPDGTPAASYQMLNRGYYDTGTGQNAMKQAFADFLKLRSGGWSPTTTATRNFMYGLLPDHPYRALSFPDIQYTVMRPALPIPAADEQLQDRVPFVSTGTPLDVGQRYLDATFATEFDNDPMNPDPRLVTAITPPRRFFQIPDAPDLNDPANSGTASIWAGVTYPALALPDISLVDYTVQNTRLNTPGPGRFLLGGDRDEVGGNGIPNFDRRRHPLWRTEWLQKIMNLTTPRTHQYAVWITVGFFEVVRPGNPQMASVNPDLAIDRLGPELDKAAGRNVRYRGFFLLDRTRTVGFNPANPGDFRDVITYRRRIQ
jgi:hypothetical protein